MKRVSAIELIPGRTDRFFVSFEDGGKIKCYLNNIADFSLRLGTELEDSRYDELIKAAELSHCRDRAARMLAARPHSEGELVRKLRERGESAENAASAVEWLNGLGLLNELEYARSIVRRCAAKGFGRAKAKDELYRRFIPREIWDDALEEFSEDNEAIDRLIDRKLRGEKPDRDDLRKMKDTLRRRGFGWDEINNAIRRYLESIEDD